MTKLKLSYTLFKPDGTPLRATAKASFTEFTNKVKLAKEETKSSPDLSHVRIVKAGDTLPLLCDEIYGSSDYCPQVAHSNNLAGFRNIQEGTLLIFPPLAAESPMS
jgi:nucleoid-associated protein YgaU